MSIKNLYTNEPQGIYDAVTHADGPKGTLPLTPDMLKTLPSGNIFGMTMNAGEGWSTDTLANGDVMIISTKADSVIQMAVRLLLGFIKVIMNWIFRLQKRQMKLKIWD